MQLYGNLSVPLCLSQITFVLRTLCIPSVSFNCRFNIYRRYLTYYSINVIDSKQLYMYYCGFATTLINILKLKLEFLNVISKSVILTIFFYRSEPVVDRTLNTVTPRQTVLLCISIRHRKRVSKVKHCSTGDTTSADQHWTDNVEQAHKRISFLVMKEIRYLRVAALVGATNVVEARSSFAACISRSSPSRQ